MQGNVGQHQSGKLAFLCAARLLLPARCFPFGDYTVLTQHTHTHTHTHHAHTRATNKEGKNFCGSHALTLCLT
jgi:hypothetical protein